MALVAQARERMASGALTEALRLFKRATELDPDSDELAEEYALVLINANASEEEALRQLQRARELTPIGEAVLGQLLFGQARTPQEYDEAVRHLEAAVQGMPESDTTRLTLVQALLNLDRGEAALAALEPLLGGKETDPTVALLAGQALRQVRRFEEAVAALQRAAAFPPTEVRATLELVETLRAARRYREAADTLGAFLKTHGATLEGLSRLGALLFSANDLGQAREVLDDVLARDENYFEALFFRATVAEAEGDLEGAERFLRRARAQRADPEVGLGLASVLRRQGKCDEARALLEELWSKGGRFRGSDDDVREELARRIAFFELNVARSPQGAKAWLDRLPEQPMPAPVLMLWGEYFRLRKAFAEGLAWLAAHPPDAGAAERLHRRLRAEFLLGTDEVTQALEIVDELATGDEEDVLAGVAALQAAKRFHDAVPRVRQALARFPDSSELRYALASSLERSGAWDEAVAELRALLEQEPDNPAVLNYLGYSFADRGVNLEEARELLAKAAALEPYSGAIQDSLGWAYFKLGDLEQAEKYLRMAMRLEPNDPTIHEHMADLLRARGDAEGAAALYRRALDLGPEEEGQPERIEAKLAEIERASSP